MRNGQLWYCHFPLILTIYRHEHLYQSIEEKLIRSDDLPKDKVGMARLILDSNIILCTLSMMLNPKLRNNGTFSIVPPRCLVIDEASQINAFEFMVTRALHLQNPNVTAFSAN